LNTDGSARRTATVEENKNRTANNSRGHRRHTTAKSNTGCEIVIQKIDMREKRQKGVMEEKEER